MATATKPLTIEDFEQLPSEMAEDHELVDGELIDVSGNTPRHYSIQGRLFAAVLNFLAERPLGTVFFEQEYDFDGNAHGPDVSFFSVEKAPLLDPDKRVQRFVPDLAIEIASPNDTFTYLTRKRARYRSCGTSEVWIVSPEICEVTVYSDRGVRILLENEELSTDLLPGFRMPVNDLFRSKTS